MFCEQFVACLRLPPPQRDQVAILEGYLAFAQGANIEPEDGGRRHPPKWLTADEVTVKLGSIHSVKGRTVDAILVLETEVFRHPKSAMDLETVLPHAFGVAERDFSAEDVQLSAATNVFVGVTRPRELLALALRREVASDAMRAAALRQGWLIRDLSRSAP
jgi:hypothetical protein